MGYISGKRALITTLVILGSFASIAHSQTSTLPAPWASQDVGSPAVAGSVSVSSGTYTITSAGADIWGTADQFRFVYQQMTGDGELVARVTGITAAHAWSKAGVTMRETLTAGSKHAYALVSAGRGVAFQKRVSTNGSSTNIAGTLSAAPRWVRLVRSGSAFQAFESADGQTWQSIGTSTITMASTIYVGLAVTSHNTSATTTATISNVAVRPAATNQPPTVSLTFPANGSTYTSPATIALQATASDADGTISNVEFYRDSTLVGTALSSPYSYTWSNVAAGTYSLTAVATDNVGARTLSATATVTVSDSAGTPPAPWTSEDVGAPAIAGTTSYNSTTSTFTVQGAGTDIWGYSDQFHFVHQLLTGDGEIVARVGSLGAVNAWSKAGVMIRENLTAGSKHAMALVTASNGVAFQRRPTTGGTSLHTAGSLVASPCWVRLVRKGDVFNAYEAPDGGAWKLIGSETITMLQTVYVGFAVTSHNATAATTATFTNVTFTESTSTNQAPTVALTSPASGALSSAPTTVTLTASASDSDGTIAKVDFYAGSTLIGSDATAPYSVNWSNAAPGSYLLTAVATDDSGATATSAAVTVTLNPSYAVFTASLDDATLVTSYRLDIFPAGADPNTATPVATQALGKPTPVNGDITVDITATLQPLAPGTYIATVLAIGSGVSSRSAPSAAFMR